MKKFILLIILAVLISSCARQQVIDIGMVVSLTGNYSPLLTTARNGALLAVEEINNRDEKLKLNLIVEDDESDSLVVVQQTEKLIDRELGFLIMSVTSGAFAEVEDLINNNDVLAISPTVASDAFKGKDDNFIRMTPDVSGFAEALGSYALEQNKKRVAIIYDSNNMVYSQKMIETFTSVIETAKEAVEMFQIEYNTLDSPSFKDLGNQIEGWQPDSVLIIANPFDTALICQHLQGNEYLKLLAAWAFSDELIENGGRSVEGVVVYIKDEHGKNEAAYLKFADDYEERFGNRPSFQALGHYDAINFFYSILRLQKKYDPASVKQAILDSGGYLGITLNYNIDKYGDCSHPLVPYTIKNGKMVRLE